MTRSVDSFNSYGKFTISKTHAQSGIDMSTLGSSSLDKVKYLSQGKKTTRLNFSPDSLNSAQKATQVYVETRKFVQFLIALFVRGKYVKMKRQHFDGRKGQLLINIGSVTKRLGITKEEIKIAQDQDKSSLALASEQIALLQLIEHAYEKYQAAIDLKQEMANNFSDEARQRSGLTQAQLEKIFSVASLAMHFEGYFNRNLDDSQHTQICAIKDSRNAANIYLIHYADLIGKGSFGKVMAVDNLLSDEPLVAKRAYINKDFLSSAFNFLLTKWVIQNEKEICKLFESKEEFSTLMTDWSKGDKNVFSLVSAEQKKFITKHYTRLAQKAKEDVRNTALKDIRNEYAVLQELHKEGRVLGLQLPPHQVIKDPKSPHTPVNSLSVGYIGVKYDGDLTQVIKGRVACSKQELMQGAKVLLSALNQMVQKGYVHGDIKPENCFVKRSISGELEFYLGDLGGARKLEEAETWHTHTPTYISKSDKETFLANRRSLRDINSHLATHAPGAEDGQFVNQKETLLTQQKKILLARDVYALGKTIAALLGIEKNDQGKFRLDDSPLGLFIRGMLRTDYTQRSTLEEVLNQFSKILIN